MAGEAKEAKEIKEKAKPLNGKMTILVKDGQVELPTLELEGVASKPYALALDILGKAAQALQIKAMQADF